MKKFAIAAVAALVAASAFAAASWVGNSYIVIGDTWYDCSGSGHDSFDGANLGEFDSLSLIGQLQIWEQGDIDWGGGAGILYASIDGGAAQEIELPYLRFEPNNNIMQNTTPVLVSDGLKTGEHTLTVWFSDNDKTQWDSNPDPGSGEARNYTATFTKTIPEPATMSLLGLGALAMVIRRKLRK